MLATVFLNDDEGNHQRGTHKYADNRQQIDGMHRLGIHTLLNFFHYDRFGRDPPRLFFPSESLALG